MVTRVKNEDNLTKALNLVLEHQKQIEREIWERINRRALDVTRGDASKKNLKKWFIFATGPRWRGGPPPELERRKEMLSAFDDWYEKVKDDIIPDHSGQEAMDRIVKSLSKIKGIGPKIAGVYLRDVVYRLGVWPQLEEYLYLPIDRHVRDILINKLHAFDEDGVPEVGESYFSAKNRRFQQVLDQVHEPRIEFDYFWNIGSSFCSYYLCDFCWIREVCRDKSPLRV